jgi:hypothetical protein
MDKYRKLEKALFYILCPARVWRINTKSRKPHYDKFFTATGKLSR